jgi:hypothetical protein
MYNFYYSPNFMKGSFNIKLTELVSLVGFEPTTRCLEGSCSVRLSYRDIIDLSVAQKNRNKQGAWRGIVVEVNPMKSDTSSCRVRML